MLKLLPLLSSLLGSKNILKPLLYMGGSVAAYHLLAKPALKNLGFLKTAEETKLLQNQKELTQSITKEIGSGALTLPIYKYKELAEIIYNALYSAILPDDEDAVYAAVKQLNSKADVLKLIEVFGFRKRDFQNGTPVPLGAFMRFAMDDKEMNKVNGFLQLKNIDYTF